MLKRYVQAALNIQTHKIILIKTDGFIGYFDIGDDKIFKAA